MYNAANLFTLLRVLMVPVFILLLAYRHVGPAFGVFVLASVTDWLDGALARRLDTRTQLGAFLDPMADKLLVLAAYGMLTLAGPLPLWMPVLAFTRDLLVVSGYLVLSLARGPVTVKPTWWGKASVFAQMAALSALLLGLWLKPSAGSLRDLTWALGAALLFSFLSGLDYVVRGILKFEEGDAVGRPR